MSEWDMEKDILIPLLEQGVEAGTLSRALNLDAQYLNALPATRQLRIADEEEINSSILRLMTMGIDEGKKILTEGTPAVKTRFILSLLSTYIKNFSSQAPQEMEDMRAELINLFHEVSTPEVQEAASDAP